MCLNHPELVHKHPAHLVSPTNSRKTSMRIILRPRGRPEEKDVRVCHELRFSLAGLPTMSRLKLKLCKCCKHVFQSKRKAEYSLSDQATKRMSVQGH